jgi:NarL family two-component system response regulator LiaR
MRTGISDSTMDLLDPEVTIRVLIVDDHAMVRQGLRTFLELHDEVSADDPSALPIEVVGEAANGVEAVDLARRLQPDVVLLDLVMPGMDGIEATPRIIEDSPHSRVIILTSFGEEDKVFPAIRAGAQGYLLKDIAPDDLVEAVRAAYVGQVQLHPDIARKLMLAVSTREDSLASQPEAPFGELTERELEVLRLIARGFNNREIAEKLVISAKTVKTHVSSILGKLHLEDRTQAAIYALRHGLAPDEA